MSRLWRPLAGGAVVVVAVFALAKAQLFEPSAVKAAGPGDATAGQAVFESKCAGCHGVGGEGGSPGPRLVGSGLTAADITTRVEQGAGVMPAGLVSGQDEADVVAYVVSITSQ
jgi:ubiquinol-cytochrome c reductase cytochrome c subunit